MVNGVCQTREVSIKAVKRAAYFGHRSPEQARSPYWDGYYKLEQTTPGGTILDPQDQLYASIKEHVHC